MMNVEARLEEMHRDFVDASVHAVHYVVKSKVPSLNLFNLYGDGADKFMAGGLFIRRAKNWVVKGRSLSSESALVIQGSNSSGLDVNMINTKIASLNVRTMALLRH